MFEGREQEPAGEFGGSIRRETNVLAGGGAQYKTEVAYLKVNKELRDKAKETKERG